MVRIALRARGEHGWAGVTTAAVTARPTSGSDFALPKVGKSFPSRARDRITNFLVFCARSCGKVFSFDFYWLQIGRSFKVFWTPRKTRNSVHFLILGRGSGNFFHIWYQMGKFFFRLGGGLDHCHLPRSSSDTPCPSDPLRPCSPCG